MHALRRLVFVAPFLTLALRAESDSLESVRKAAGDLIKVRTETARLTHDWAIERELLSSATQALAERASAAEANYQLQVEKRRGDEETLAALKAKKERAQSALEQAEQRMKKLGEDLVALRPTLPPRLAVSLEVGFNSLASPTLPPGERMQLTMNLLSRCMQFDGSITRSEELVTIDGKPLALEVVYWGLSRAYAVDRSAGKAWYGSPVSGRWTWEGRDEAYAEIVKLMAIQAGKADPEFVFVPAKVAATKQK